MNKYNGSIKSLGSAKDAKVKWTEGITWWSEFSSLKLCAALNRVLLWGY